MDEKLIANWRENVAACVAERGAVRATAEAAGISRVYLSYCIHGRSVPSLAIALRIAAALEIPLADLLVSPRSFSKILAKSA